MTDTDTKPAPAGTDLQALRELLTAALEDRMIPVPDVPMPTEGEGE